MVQGAFQGHKDPLLLSTVEQMLICPIYRRGDQSGCLVSRPGSPSRPALGSVSQASEPDIPWLFSQPLGVVCGQSPRDEQPHYLTGRNYSPSLRKPHLLLTFVQTLYDSLTLQCQVTSSLATQENQGKPRSGRTRGSPQGYT